MTRHLTQSQQAFRLAQEKFPGGVNSPVRSFGAVGGEPFFVKRATGSKVIDIDGNEYIDYVCSWGPAILGHAHPAVTRALEKACSCGTSFGAPTETETRLAEIISEAIPSMEMMRFVNSGTESTMSALRLARGATGRNKILKFEGCYHGHVDSLLVKAGSGAATHGEPTSKGITAECAKDTIVCRYNDLSQVESVFGSQGKEIAAIIVEPVAGNMGCVLPEEGFLARLRRLADACGALLIFDEVMTGFRLGFGGAQNVCGVTPDLTCLGKIIGGGLPVGAYGGRRGLMKQVSPLGPVYQAGTLSGNPLAMTAGLETLQQLQAPGVYEQLTEKTQTLTNNIDEVLYAAHIDHTMNTIGSMWTLFFTSGPVKCFDDVMRSDSKRFQRFFHFLLERGIFLPPSPFESAFLSLAHTEADLKNTVATIDAWTRDERQR